MNGTQPAFITRPVADLPPGLRADAKVGLTAAFRALPQDMAIFLPRHEGRTFTQVCNSVTGNLVRVFRRKRLIHTRVDRSADGIWVWWEPRKETE